MKTIVRQRRIEVGTSIIAGWHKPGAMYENVTNYRYGRLVEGAMRVSNVVISRMIRIGMTVDEKGTFITGFLRDVRKLVRRRA